MSTETLPVPALTIGDITCHIISDGQAAYAPEFLFANAERDLLDPAIRDRLDEDGNIATPYHCLLLQTPSANVLVDTGLGRHAAAVGAPAGHLATTLAAAGFAPTDIVIVSHAHPDHIGGLVTDRELAFPAARHIMSRIEWDFWTSEDNLAQLPEMLAAPARAVLPPLLSSNVLDLADGETDIVDGVRLLPAPGHTPGHCAVAVTAGGASLTFLADTVIDELQLRNPHWTCAVDLSADDTVRTRKRLLDRAAAEGSTVMAYHMMQSGHLERHDHAYRLITSSTSQ
jgi:glyoxylase-like metal-dependent hydrolase (beta-lactamase superfamily II)